MGRKAFTPLHPNRTGGFPAYGSPVDGFYINKTGGFCPFASDIPIFPEEGIFLVC
jgi:hypothetical protein